MWQQLLPSGVLGDIFRKARSTSSLSLACTLLQLTARLAAAQSSNRPSFVRFWRGAFRSSMDQVNYHHIDPSDYKARGLLKGADSAPAGTAFLPLPSDMACSSDGCHANGVCHDNVVPISLEDYPISQDAGSLEATDTPSSVVKNSGRWQKVPNCMKCRSKPAKVCT